LRACIGGRGGLKITAIGALPAICTAVMIATLAGRLGRLLMRRKNMRVVITGGALIVLAVVFFLFFLSIAKRSNDPAALMGTVGTVSGVAIGIGVAMIVAGMIGKQV
jgi:hypothetical protein